MDPRLTAAIEDVLGRPVSWGANDCVMWATAASEAFHGADLLGNEWRGRWASEGDAHDILPLGLGVAVARRLRMLGWPPVASEEGSEGDIALVRIPQRDGAAVHALAVMARPGWAVARCDLGVRFCPRNEIVRVWRCPL